MVGSTETVIDLLREIVEAQREMIRLLRKAERVRQLPDFSAQLSAGETVAISGGREPRQLHDEDGQPLFFVVGSTTPVRCDGQPLRRPWTEADRRAIRASSRELRSEGAPPPPAPSAAS